MVVDFAGVSARRGTFRTLALVGTALGSTLVITPAATAQNLISTNNTTDVTITETGTRSGGPRTVDIATSGGNIALDFGTVNSDNVPANNPSNPPVIGVAISAVNTGSGSVSVITDAANTTGSLSSTAIVASAISGPIMIDAGPVNANNTATSRGIQAASGAGNISVISTDVVAGYRGIFTTSNGAAPNNTFFTTGTTTINAGNTTVTGVNIGGTGPNAIIAQGFRAELTSVNAAMTNAAAVSGAAIFVNTGTGGALVNAGTTTALGQNASALQVFSSGTVDVTSGTIRTTQSSDGLSIQSGTDVIVRSTSVTTEGGNGAYGIVLGANRGGGGFNGGPNGFAYTSANVISGTVTTAGPNSHAIYATPNGSGSTTITSNTISTAGANANGIFVAPIGSGTLTGSVAINSTGALNTAGTGSTGILTQNSTGVVAINNSGTITTANARGISVQANSGDVSVVSNNISTGGANQFGIIVGGFSQGATAANVAITNNGTLTTNGATATGIQVQGGAGTTLITNNGSINATGFGISVIPTTGSATIAGTGSITSTNVGVLINSGTAPVSVTTGAITTTGASGTGVQVSNNGTTSITTGAIVTSGAQASGISATGINGAITINASDTRTSGANANAAIAANQANGAVGAINVTTGIVRSATTGINVSGGTGPNVVTVNATDTQSVLGAIQAFSGGAVSVISGTARSTTTNDVTTILAQSSAGAASVSSTNLTSASSRGIFAFGLNDVSVVSGTLTATGGAPGIFALAANTVGSPQNGGAAGFVTVQSGTLTSTGGGINAFGPRATVNVDSITLTAGNTNRGALEAYGLDVLVNSGTIVTASNGINAGNADGAVRGANVVINSGSVTMNGADTGTSSGIFANGENILISSGTIIGTGTGNRVGINAVIGLPASATTPGPLPGALTVNSGSITTVGDGAYGIRALSDAGLVTVNSTGTITTIGGVRPISATTNRYSDGITATSFNGSAAVTSNNITTSGTEAVGIRVEIGSGVTQNTPATNPVAGTATVTSNGAITTQGTQSAGILVQAGAGVANVTNTGSISTTGAGATGIQVNGTTGALSVTSRQINTQSTSATGIAVNSTSGSITINATNVATTGAEATGLLAQSTTGAISIQAGTVSTANDTTGIRANSTDGNVSITAERSTVAGSAPAGGGIAVIGGNAVDGRSTNGAVTINSNVAISANGSAVSAIAGGTTRIESGFASSAAAQAATLYGVSNVGNVFITANDTSATGAGGTAVEGHAASNLSILLTRARAAQGNGIFGEAGGLATVNASIASAMGDGNAGVEVIGGTGVDLSVSQASSTGALVTDAATGQVARADAIFATAINGTINARILDANALGANADAVRLIANGTGGAVTALIQGRVTSEGGYALFIDPPGAVNIAVDSSAIVLGTLGGINTTGGSNTIVNNGLIGSFVNSGIVASGQTILDNRGNISGGNGVAVQLGASNDMVTLRTGSIITGAIAGGGGTDNSVLIGTGTAPVTTQTVATFQGFNNLTVQSGYWTAPTTTGTTVASTTIASGASLELANGVTGLGYVSPTITNNGALIVRSPAAAAGSILAGTSVTGTGTTLFTGPGTATLGGTTSFANTGANTVDTGSTVL
ncbi:MAG: hypothetical protein V4659_07430, partial [Pseudomonadota bacterium]